MDSWHFSPGSIADYNRLPTSPTQVELKLRNTPAVEHDDSNVMKQVNPYRNEPAGSGHRGVADQRGDEHPPLGRERRRLGVVQLDHDEEVIAVVLGEVASV
jgi:hypothetical protein